MSLAANLDLASRIELTQEL